MLSNIKENYYSPVNHDDFDENCDGCLEELALKFIKENPESISFEMVSESESRGNLIEMIYRYLTCDIEERRDLKEEIGKAVIGNALDYAKRVYVK